MNIEEFDFYLPDDLIAHEPIKERDKCRLLVVNREDGTFNEEIFRNIVDYLNEGDVLVLNNSKVIKSRIYPYCRRNKKNFEVLVTNFLDENTFTALVKNIRRLRVGDILELGNFEFSFQGILDGLGIFKSNKKFTTKELNEIGQIPLPPYIERKREKIGLPKVNEEDEVFYQTVYSSIYGSIASPTAGLHFTEELLEEVSRKGVIIKYITLHVGLGTFEPVRTQNVEEFKLKGEYMEVNQDVVDSIFGAKKRGNKVVAVGTTVVRALETVFSQNEVKEYKGITDIFIYPGYQFKVVNAIVTNFHLPKSSLILLVAAFAGKDLIMKAYNFAIDKRFRFYSYGDAMLIV
ncbi:MAG: tRNA preQ1(34) S-adenosylmethionine ribosyltransferase-isomerase QueA [Brevinematia bacterium]